MQITGIIDEPVEPGGKDNLGIAAHSRSLIKFIENSETPITIGIQGEWGSGKTSLLNGIYHVFDERSDVKQIWINSWEFSLLSSPEEALLKIINKIIEDLLACDKKFERGQKVKDGVNQIFKGALRVSASMALGLEAGQVAKELMETGGKNISDLRVQLTELIENVASKNSNPYTKFIIYVDDLDRIEPKNAVAVLELLKNIFSLPNCIFMLAIDYQVVVKGLEHKFGKPNAKNEWEFRAFFDKIIQLPFMMPMGQYDIGKYVTQLLIDVHFISENDFDNFNVKDVILGSIGGNPRSIKRLINSVSLIRLFTESKREIDDQASETDSNWDIDETEQKFLLFCLLCIQIAYPHIYTLLLREPNFASWDDEFAFQDTEKREERRASTFASDFEFVKKTEYCEEKEIWQQALYRICYVRPRLKIRFRDISTLMKRLKDEFFKDSQESIGQVLSEILSQTSVTNVTSTDSPQQEKKPFTRTMYDGLNDWFSKLKTEGFSEEIIRQVRKTHEIIELYAEKTMFSETGGCTYYFNSKKIAALTIRSKKNPTLEVRFLKNSEHKFRLPEITGLTTNHVRKFDPNKPTTVAFANFYCINLKPAQLEDPDIQRTLDQLARENIDHVKTRLQYPTRSMIDEQLKLNHDEAVKKYKKELSDNYKYPFELKDH